MNDTDYRELKHELESIAQDIPPRMLGSIGLDHVIVRKSVLYPALANVMNCTEVDAVQWLDDLQREAER